jgi:hypothetical protein
MSKSITVPDEHVPTVENALDAVDGDPDLPDVDRSRGRTPEGKVSTGRAVAIVAEAFTGWSR